MGSSRKCWIGLWVSISMWYYDVLIKPSAYRFPSTTINYKRAYKYVHAEGEGRQDVDDDGVITFKQAIS